MYQNTPIDQVPPLTLEPRGTTALLDAIGRFITEIGSGLAATTGGRIAPAKSAVVVLTDGHENASREWTKDAVKQLISQQEDKYGWDFVFLGANIDAVDVGTDLGFSAGKSLTYDASSAGVGGAFASVSSYNARKRSRGAKSASDITFDDADRRRARGQR